MNEYTTLARNAIEEYTKTGKIIDVPHDISSELLTNKAGVFVTIHKNNKSKSELRGCIGTYKPTKDSIAEEIISNAISASSRDYRFLPLNKSELDNIFISVDVLSKPELIDDILVLDPQKYGIIIISKDKSKTGILLPNIEGVHTIHDQIAITLKKAQLSSKDEVDIYRFVVNRYEEN